MQYTFFLISLLTLSYWSTAQINSKLTPITSNDSSPIGTADFQWACVANFQLSDTKNHGRIKYLDTDQKGNIYAIDNNGYMYALNGNDFSETWKVYLGYEHILNMEASPDGKTIAICYNYIKTGTKKLEVRNAENGRILLKIKRKPRCYEESYFADVVGNTTLYPFDIAYSPDGSKLAVWFKNHGFDENQCKAHLEEQFIIMSPLTGDVSASRQHIPNDFEWKKCTTNYAFAFSPDAQSIYISNCKGELVQYDSKTLTPIRQKAFGTEIQQLLKEQLGDKGSKKFKFSFHTLQTQKNGDLITSIGKQGRIFRIKADLSSMHYVTQNQGALDGHFSFSPDASMLMLNGHQTNLWDLNTKQPILYTQVPNAFDANTVRFHPIKKAIIVGTKRNLKILAPCPLSTIHIGNNFTPTGHFLNAETSFSVRGSGRIYWAFGKQEIIHKKAKETEIATEILGYSNLFNNEQNIPQPTQLQIKTDQPGTYTIFGGTKRAMTNKEVLQNLENWKP